MSTMRQAMGNLRYQWLGLRIDGLDATLRGRWVVLSVSLVLVFACFFAIGRHRAGGGAASAAGTPSALVGPSGQAPIPTGLSGGSPIAGAVPVAIAVKPRPRPVVAPVSRGSSQSTTTGQSFTAESSSGESPSSESKSSSEPPPEPVPQPAPSKASAPVRSAGGSGSSGQGSAKGGSTSSGGAGFDTSE
jgi:hypothetical protein